MDLVVRNKWWGVVVGSFNLLLCIKYQLMWQPMDGHQQTGIPHGRGMWAWLALVWFGMSAMHLRTAHQWPRQCGLNLFAQPHPCLQDTHGRRKELHQEVNLSVPRCLILERFPFEAPNQKSEAVETHQLGGSHSGKFTGVRKSEAWTSSPFVGKQTISWGDCALDHQQPWHQEVEV